MLTSRAATALVLVTLSLSVLASAARASDSHDGDHQAASTNFTVRPYRTVRISDLPSGAALPRWHRPDSTSVPTHRPGTGQDTAERPRTVPATAGVGASAAVTVGFDGLFGGLPDTQVGAGPRHIIETNQGVIQIFTRYGQAVTTITYSQIFGDFCCGDPNVIFDVLSNRWIISGLGFDESNTFGSVYLGVSTTDDPTGVFNAYHFPTTAGVGPDFPKIGVNEDKVAIEATIFPCNPFCFSGSFVGSQVTILNKAQLLAGGSVSATSFGPVTTAFTIQPATTLSPTPTLYLDAFQGPVLRIWSINGVPGVGSGTTMTVTDLPARRLTDAPDAVQKGSSTLITVIDTLSQGLIYRDGVLWTVGTGGCTPPGDTTTRSCIRFMQANTAPLAVAQDFDLATAGTYYYYPAIQTDRKNNLIVVVNRSSANEYVSVYGTGRLATDPPNTLETPALLRAGTVPLQTCSDHCWGDYSGASVDGLDQRAVWVAGEYMRGPGGFDTGTWIAQVRFLAVCTPRPPVRITTTRETGRLRVTVAASGQLNTLAALRFGEPRVLQNALIDIGAQVGQTGAFTVTLPTGTTQTTFFVRHASAGATTVPLIVQDDCGNWSTFVGGGQSAF